MVTYLPLPFSTSGRDRSRRCVGRHHAALCRLPSGPKSRHRRLQGLCHSTTSNHPQRVDFGNAPRVVLAHSKGILAAAQSFQHSAFPRSSRHSKRPISMLRPWSRLPSPPSTMIKRTMKRTTRSTRPNANQVTTFGSDLGLSEILAESSTNDGPVFDPLTMRAPSILGDTVVRAVDELQFGGRNTLYAYRGGVTMGVVAPMASGFVPGGIVQGVFLQGVAAAFDVGAANAHALGAIVQEDTFLHVSLDSRLPGSVRTQIAALCMFLYEGQSTDPWMRVRTIFHWSTRVALALELIFVLPEPDLVPSRSSLFHSFTPLLHLHSLFILTFIFIRLVSSYLLFLASQQLLRLQFPFFNINFVTRTRALRQCYL
ncbi:hypothetical protein DFH09DRAFT_499518 [Mycena vulgaris]|nr:hypothetical protein DFH09DRAFT_499518 [Mycena vulgaris]